MEKSQASQTNPEEIKNRSGPNINSLIKQYATLKTLLEKSNKELQYWKRQKSQLLQSNSNIETNVNKLSQTVSKIEAEIREYTGIYDAKKEELKDQQGARTATLDKQWSDCSSEIGSYADDFSQWITNYSRDVLMKEIENHQKDCGKVGQELAIMKQELDDMKGECDTEYVEANADDLSYLNDIIFCIRSGNNNLKKNVRLREEELNKIQNKIKQSKVALNDAKTKENANAF